MIVLHNVMIKMSGNIAELIAGDFFHRKNKKTAIIQGFDIDDINKQLNIENNELKKQLFLLQKENEQLKRMIR